MKSMVMADPENLGAPHKPVENQPFTVTAIISTYNEADIIAHTVGELLSQGIFVYLIDTGSTDATLTEVQRFLGHGLLCIEKLPIADFSLTLLMKRKEALACEIHSDWFINADADEFRESPWTGVSLLDGIRLVDGLGYNAIDFAVLDFVPTHDNLNPGEDPREAFPYFEPGPYFNKLQIRCWKKTDSPVDLATSGGHEAVFPGRKVFPIRFILRHYPFRGQAHGERKVFQERRTRYHEEEKKTGWHIQYDDIADGHRFVRGKEGLELYDPERIRIYLQIENRTVEAIKTKEQNLLQACKDRDSQIISLAETLSERDEQITSLARTLNEREENFRETLSEKETQIENLNHEMMHLQNLRISLDEARRSRDRTVQQLQEVYDSVSWRITQPLRRLGSILIGLKHQASVARQVLYVFFTKAVLVLSGQNQDGNHVSRTKNRHVANSGKTAFFSLTDPSRSLPVSCADLSKDTTNRSYFLTAGNKSDFDPEAVRAVLDGIVQKLLKEHQR